MDASMNSAIRATIPLLTAPLADICNPGALDSLHVALMSTLSAHLLPTWDTSRPALGAPLRTLHFSPTSVPRPLERAAHQIRINAADWVALMLAHNRTGAMSISIDPGMVAIQFAEQPMPRVYWQEELLSSFSTRSSSPVSPASTSSSLAAASSVSSGNSDAAAASAPWNARKSRLPSLVAASARQVPSSASSSSKMLVGSPRTPKSFNGFSFPSSNTAPQLANDEEEPTWMTNLLSMFPDAPAPAPAKPAVYRPPQARAVGAGLTRNHHHMRTESTESWTSSSAASSSRSQSSPVQQRIYSQLALNMSQLSLASTTSSAPSLASCHSSSSSASSSSSSSSSSQRAASPELELTPSPIYMDDGLPSPISPTASAYAYVDHAARTSVTEYECGKVGVLGGAVMLGVPAGAKAPSKRMVNTANAGRRSSATAGLGLLPARGAMPNFGRA